MKILKFVSRLAIAVIFPMQVCFAQIPTFGGENSMVSGSEYFAGKYEGKPLIKVNVVSGLRMSGVYHVPVDTDLAELIAYGGGASDGANLKTVRISSEKNKSHSLKTYNFYSITKDNKNMPVLANGDVVQIDIEKDSLARTAIWVGIATGVTTVILSALAYKNSK